jgi:hypothetical protein
MPIDSPKCSKDSARTGLACCSTVPTRRRRGRSRRERTSAVTTVRTMHEASSWRCSNGLAMPMTGYVQLWLSPLPERRRSRSAGQAARPDGGNPSDMGSAHSYRLVRAWLAFSPPTPEAVAWSVPAERGSSRTISALTGQPSSYTGQIWVTFGPGPLGPDRIQ